VTGPLRVAILSHSTNPRGGVVHALALGDALTEIGHDVMVHAPGTVGRGFFREARCNTRVVPATPAAPGFAGFVETRITDYVRHFESEANRHFDVFHAQDGISGNALATLKERGLIGGFARTVHHIDSFEDARVAELQERSILAADRHFVVSTFWRDTLLRRYGLEAVSVGNGVDRATYSPQPDGREATLRARFGLGAGPVLLSIGGVEERKNTLRILQAFRQLRVAWPQARLLIVGGASLLDHSGYQRAFSDELEQEPEAKQAVILAGPQAQADMPALYRLADALVFPSVKEGFGLVALEAMACGTPVVTSQIAPFNEHFGAGDVVWCDPYDPASIAEAMEAVLDPAVRDQLQLRREKALAPHRWDRCAAAHLPAYFDLRETTHA